MQEFETNGNRLARLDYLEASEDLRRRIALITFISGIRDTELQQTLRMAGHENSSNAIVRTSQFENIRSANDINRSMQSRCRKAEQMSH